MMTDRELMQMALDALEAMQSYARAEKKGLRICDESIEALRDRLAQPEPEPVGYAGVIIWIGEHRISRLLTKTEIEHERVVGMSITETAQRCLDLLSEAKEKNT